jgi:CubicO group peptidase (beta-lactamase class C family)
MQEGRMTTLDDLAEFARQHEKQWPRDPADDIDAWGIHRADPPPWNRLFGPVHPRGPCSGVIWRHGREVGAWGEPDRPDLTFSVAKTYLALLAGVAHDRDLLPDPDEPVIARVRGIGFESPHNRQVTWTHLLQQTSEWEGSCFDIPETVDRYRAVEWQPTKPDGRKGDPRPLFAPGTYWEYNDVRINQLSLALLHLFGRPLPDVFEQAITRPAGASDTWRWVGYDNSWVQLPQPGGGTRRVQSVPGGSHWGGGISIGARDQARIGQVLLGRGCAGERRVLSQAWVDRMLEPCPIAPFYGYLTWLNRERRVFPSASADSVFAIGAGGQYTWIDPQRDAVVVVRWLESAHADRMFEMIGRMLDESTLDPAQ